MVYYENLRTAVNSAKLKDGEIISCASLDHYLMFTAKNKGWLPAEYRYPSNIVDGLDIYMWRSIKRDFKRPIIVHELAEFLFKRELEKPGNSLSIPDYIAEDIERSEKAHKFARECDDRYARETLDEQTYLAYRKFRNTVVNGHQKCSG